MEKTYINWEDCEGLCKKLHEKIDFKFDHILCISRGGLILGRLLSEYSEKPLSIISVKSYNGEKKEDLKIGTISFIEELCGNILIVDDVVDSGETFTKVLEYLKNNFQFDNVKTASIYFKNNENFKPDFFVEETDKWIIFPYEKTNCC